MAGRQTPFSKREVSLQPPEITVREDAPDSLRVAVCNEAFGLGVGSELRDHLCALLKKWPDRNNWGDYSLKREAEGLLRDASWPKVYDLIEDLHQVLKQEDESRQRSGEERLAPKFAVAINECLVDEGIGWQLKDGLIRFRGEQAFEVAVTSAAEILATDGFHEASDRIRKALNDLSQRPPDYAGAISHAFSAMEAASRHITSNEKATLGGLIAQGKLDPYLKPHIKEAVDRLWKFANDEGARHGKEGANLGDAEAEFTVGIVANVLTYLVKRVH